MISEKKINTTIEKIKYIIETSAPSTCKISDVNITPNYIRTRESIVDYQITMKVTFEDVSGTEEVTKQIRIIDNQIMGLVKSTMMDPNGNLSLGDNTIGGPLTPIILDFKSNYFDYINGEKCVFKLLFEVLLD